MLLKKGTKGSRWGSITVGTVLAGLGAAYVVYEFGYAVGKAVAYYRN